MKKPRMTAILTAVLCRLVRGIVDQLRATSAHNENGRREIRRGEALQAKLRSLPWSLW